MVTNYNKYEIGWIIKTHDTSHTLKTWLKKIQIKLEENISGGACCVMVIVVGNGHGDTSSNRGWDSLHFT